MRASSWRQSLELEIRFPVFLIFACPEESRGLPGEYPRLSSGDSDSEGLRLYPEMIFLGSSPGEFYDQVGLGNTEV